MNVQLLRESLWDIKQAAEFLNVSVSWLQRAARRNEVPSLRIGRLVRFSRALLEHWIAKENETALKQHGIELEGPPTIHHAAMTGAATGNTLGAPPRSEAFAPLAGANEHDSAASKPSVPPSIHLLPERCVTHVPSPRSDRKNLKVSEVARRLGLRPTTVYLAINRGELKSVRNGPWVSVTEEDLDEYLSSRRKG